MEICVVIPAYNEEQCIEGVLRSLCAELNASAADFGILVIDDGSSDSTHALVESCARADTRIRPIRQKNAGHGAALLIGYTEAIRSGARWIFQVDSDAQFDPSDFKALWKLREHSRFILGERTARSDARHRLWISAVLRTALRLAFGVRLADANIPFRLMRADFLDSLLKILPPGVFAPNIFLSILAARSGENLFSIPVRHFPRAGGQNSLIRWSLVKACLRSVVELASFRLRTGELPR